MPEAHGWRIMDAMICFLASSVLLRDNLIFRAAAVQLARQSNFSCGGSAVGFFAGQQSKGELFCCRRKLCKAFPDPLLQILLLFKAGRSLGHFQTVKGDKRALGFLCLELAASG